MNKYDVDTQVTSTVDVYTLQALSWFLSRLALLALLGVAALVWYCW